MAKWYVSMPRSTSTPKLLASKRGTKKGLGAVKKPIQAKKVSSFDFDDFDTTDDLEDSANAAIASIENVHIKEDVHSHAASGSLSRLAYSEDEPDVPTAKSSSSSSSSSYVSSFGSDRSSNSSAAAKKVTPTDPALATRFSNAKSISSAQYFGEDQQRNDPDKDRRLAKFSGSTSISSAAYYDRDESPDAGTDLARKLAYSATTDITQLKSIMYDSGVKLTNMANDLFSDLQSRYQ